MTGGRFGSIAHSTVDPRGLNQFGGRRDRRIDHLGDVDRPPVRALGRFARRGKEQHLLDQSGQPLRLIADDRPVLGDLFPLVNDAAGDVVGGRGDDGERCAQVVRHRGHEVHLEIS